MSYLRSLIVRVQWYSRNIWGVPEGKDVVLFYISAPEKSKVVGGGLKN